MLETEALPKTLHQFVRQRGSEAEGDVQVSANSVL